jgi:hypothetical protein
MINELIDYLSNIETWENDEAFLRDAIVLSSSKLLAKCHEEVDQNNIVIVAPLLRQVQENIIVISGLVEGVLTSKKFIKGQHNPSKIMKQIKAKGLEVKESEFDSFNEYLKGIKDMLNKYSHTNFEGVMTLFTERFQVYEVQQFNRIMMRFVISLIETPFLVMVNYIYKLNLDLPKAENYQKELKDLGTLKYITRLFPESIKEFINQSEALKGYYLNVVNYLKQTLQEYKELKPM